MRNLSEIELLSMASILEMEKNGLIVSKAMQKVITDDQLKKQGESGILACEGRIKGIQQFINENRVTEIREVH